ncbi:MAG: CBS domain-containing protein [Gammaproteobacteria bacterium]|nr:CBS domain-containing protein [Gammaproteobacteria bacterium]
MRHRPLLKLLMTPFPYSVGPETAVSDALEKMQAHAFHHLPVTDGHALVGVITERDIRNLQAGSLASQAGDELTVKNMYIHDAYIVDINEPLDNVLLEMAKRHIGSVLVTRKGNLAGVFTSTDACRGFGDFMRERFPHDDGNDAA